MMLQVTYNYFGGSMSRNEATSNSKEIMPVALTIMQWLAMI